MSKTAGKRGATIVSLEPSKGANVVKHSDRELASRANEHLPAEKANDAIRALLDSGHPFAIGRVGSVELGLVKEYLRQNLIDVPYGTHRYSDAIMRDAAMFAGVTGHQRDLNRFCATYIASVCAMDLMGIWYCPGSEGMVNLVDHMAPDDATFTSLESLMPWQVITAHGANESWTLGLAQKRVLVIHPFEASIMSNYEQRLQIKTIGQILPEFKLGTLRPPVTFAGEGVGSRWPLQFEETCARIAERKFDIALIGCGGYGLPLAAFVKALGKGAIHLGGALQLLFGITGKRWDDNEWYSKVLSAIRDHTWTRPSADEVPRLASAVEGGCYW